MSRDGKSVSDLWGKRTDAASPNTCKSRELTHQYSKRYFLVVIRTGDDVICRVDVDQVFDVEKKSLVVVALNAWYLKR